MPEVRIVITDTGNDNLTAACSDKTVEAVLMGQASPFTELTGAQQLAVIMCKAAREYVASLTATRAARRIVIPKRR